MVLLYWPSDETHEGTQMHHGPCSLDHHRCCFGCARQQMAQRLSKPLLLDQRMTVVQTLPRQWKARAVGQTGGWM